MTDVDPRLYVGSRVCLALAGGSVMGTLVEVTPTLFVIENKVGTVRHIDREIVTNVALLKYEPAKKPHQNYR